MEPKPTDGVTGPLVWIDCEMTGLDPRTDKLLEIAVLITDGNLEVVDSGISYVIKTDKETLDQMGDWCTKTHGDSGLTKACLESPYTKDYVAQQVLNYIKQWIPKRRTGVLAGNSVHQDRVFLAGEMPELVDWLHYRSWHDDGIAKHRRPLRLTIQRIGQWTTYKDRSGNFGGIGKTCSCLQASPLQLKPAAGTSCD